MIEIICLFFPTFLSLEKYNKEEGLVEYIKKYCINNIIINFIVLTVVGYINNYEFKVLDLPAFNLVFSIKYLAMSSVIALAISFLRKHILVNIEVKGKNHAKNK